MSACEAECRVEMIRCPASEYTTVDVTECMRGRVELP